MTLTDTHFQPIETTKDQKQRQILLIGALLGGFNRILRLFLESRKLQHHSAALCYQKSVNPGKTSA